MIVSIAAASEIAWNLQHAAGDPEMTWCQLADVVAAAADVVAAVAAVVGTSSAVADRSSAV